METLGNTGHTSEATQPQGPRLSVIVPVRDGGRFLIAAGGYGETMRQLEDIDLGYRVRALGHRILLRPEIQGKHLKRWTLRTMMATDLVGRGVTWMRLHLEQGSTGRPGTLNLRPAEKVFTLLTGAAAFALGMSVIRWSLLWLIVAGLCLAVVVGGNLPLLRWFARERGLRFALLVVPLRLLYYLLNVIAAAIGLVSHAVAPRRHPAPDAPAPPKEPIAR